jgi:hypothetical protein
MSDNRCRDGVQTPLCQRRKVAFQFTIVFNQGVAEFGDLHSAAVLASRACHRHGLPERLLQALDQEPLITLLGRYRRVAPGGGTAHQKAQGYEQYAEPSRHIEQVQ